MRLKEGKSRMILAANTDESDSDNAALMVMVLRLRQTPKESMIIKFS